MCGRSLGSGASGDVLEGICRSTGRAFAIKQFELQSLDARQLCSLGREVDTHSSVDHPRIVRLEAVYESPSRVQLVLERLHGGELFQRLAAGGAFSEDAAAAVAVQVLQGLAYLHARGIVHHDVKLENVMFEERGGSAVKLIDFGLAARCRRGQVLTSSCGTLQYMAPEVAQRAGHGHKADLWSLGIVVLMILTDRDPYGGSTEEIRAKTKLGSVELDASFRRLSPEARSFLRSLLAVSVARRPTALEALRQPWLHLRAPELAAAALAEAKHEVLLGCHLLQTWPRAQLGEHQPLGPVARAIHGWLARQQGKAGAEPPGSWQDLARRRGARLSAAAEPGCGCSFGDWPLALLSSLAPAAGAEEECEVSRL